jgi:hypothetical protein
MRYKRIASTALVVVMSGAALALAADTDPKKKAAEKSAPASKPAPAATTASKPNDKGAQGGIILQSGEKTGAKTATTSAKPNDTGALGVIILQSGQKNDSKAKAPAANKTAAPGG